LESKWKACKLEQAKLQEKLKSQGVCAMIRKKDGSGENMRRVLSGENMPRTAAIDWNNRITDIQVEPGCQFTGYDDYYYRTGHWSAKTWTGSNNPLLGSAYYKDISSWKCSCGNF